MFRERPVGSRKRERTGETDLVRRRSIGTYERERGKPTNEFYCYTVVRVSPVETEDRIFRRGRE